MLTEPERREKRRRHVELDADSRRQLRDEDLLGYIALTRAGSTLVLSRPRVNEDRAGDEPVKVLVAAARDVPGRAGGEIPQDVRDDVRFVETPRQVIGGLAVGAITPSPRYSWERAGERVFSARRCDGVAVAGSVPSPLPPHPLPGVPGRGRKALAIYLSMARELSA